MSVDGTMHDDARLIEFVFRTNQSGEGAGGRDRLASAAAPLRRGLSSRGLDAGRSVALRCRALSKNGNRWSGGSAALQQPVTFEALLFPVLYGLPGNCTDTL